MGCFRWGWTSIKSALRGEPARCATAAACGDPQRSDDFRRRRFSLGGFEWGMPASGFATPAACDGLYRGDDCRRRGFSLEGFEWRSSGLGAARTRLSGHLAAQDRGVGDGFEGNTIRPCRFATPAACADRYVSADFRRWRFSGLGKGGNAWMTRTREVGVVGCHPRVWGLGWVCRGWLRWGWTCSCDAPFCATHGCVCRCSETGA